MNDSYGRIAMLSLRIFNKNIFINYNINEWCFVACQIHTVLIQLILFYSKK